MADYPSWLKGWGRSPRQDRRVVENGKFVELGKIHDETIIEETKELGAELATVPVVDAVQEHVDNSQTVAEIVESVFKEGQYEEPGTDAGASAGGDVQAGSPPEVRGSGDGATGQSDGPIEGPSAGTVDAVPDAAPAAPAVLTEEESDALAETLRLPEPIEESEATGAETDLRF